MWQAALNYLQTLRTYRDLSPDAGIRRQVNTQLQNRSCLSLEEWSQLFQPQSGQGPPEALLTFMFKQLSDYSGLQVGRIRPSDRLIDDLQLPLVCWFDWPNQLCDDFYKTFQVDILEEFDESLLETIGDLVCFLAKQLPSPDSVMEE